MKVFSFFLRRMFFAKPLMAVVTLVLLLMVNYMTFTTARTVFSTLEGRQEVAHITQPGTFIQNVDPNSQFDLDKITEQSLQSVYDYLAKNHSYALYTDGYIVDLPNSAHVEVPISYMNKAYNDLNGFDVADGKGLSFDYDLGENKPISVLVGSGLAKDYPIGTNFTIKDPALERELSFVVTGVLSKDASHSNFYALDSKQYYNFSVVVPVNEAFIRQAKIAFKLNGVMDIIVTNTDRASVNELGENLFRTIHAKFNYFSQEENSAVYYSQFRSSLIFLVLATLVLLSIIIVVSVWSSLVNARLMIREFTLNLLVGLGYSKLSRICYTYYALIAGLSLASIGGLAAYSRYRFWQKRDVYFMTYGVGGLIQMDWLAMLVTLIMDIVVVALVSSILTSRLKRVPISVGVLQ